MPELLVYQTSDPRFADKAIDTMEAAGIPCFQTGHGWVDLQLTRQYLGEGICIYIRDEKDAPRANAILIELGAVVEQPVKLPSQRVLVLVTALITALVIYVATHWG